MDTLAGIAAELRAAAGAVTARGAAAVEASLYEVKQQARANATATAGVHARLYPDTITYDLDPGKLSGEVGPERRGQGNLGPILEYGSMHNLPHRDLGRALDLEEPKFLAALEKLAAPWG